MVCASGWELASLAVAPCPPLTEENWPLAVLACPPLTEEPSPLAVLMTPPLTEDQSPEIVLSNPTGSCGVQPGPVSNSYLGGTGWATDDVNAPFWVPLGLGNGREDLPFQTYVRVIGAP